MKNRSLYQGILLYVSVLVTIPCRSSAQGLSNAPSSGFSHVLSIASFDALWSNVLRENPTERVYLLNIQKAAIDHRATASFLFPFISGAFNGQDNLQLPITPVPGELVGRPGTTFDVRFGKPYTYNTGFSASQTVFDWTAVFQDRLAKSNLLLTRAQESAYEQNLKEETARYYFAVLVASSSIGVAQKDLSLADSLVSVAQSRLDQGLTDQTAFNQAKINDNDVTANLAQSRQLYDQGVGNLLLLLGRQPTDSLVLTDSFDIKKERQGIVLSLGPDKGLDVYHRQLMGATLGRKQRVAAFYPTLSLDGYFGVQQFDDAFGLSFRSGAWSDYSYLGLSLNVPLFTGFANLQKWKSATTSEYIATAQFENARLQSQINDDLLLKQYAHYLDMVRASRQNFLLYGENLELARQKFTEGLLATDGYLKIFEDYLGSENMYLNNLSNLLSTQASILARN